MRPPNTPLMQTMTLSPGSTRLAKQVSMPAEPGADTGNVSACLVWNATCSIALIWSIISMNLGSRWPMVGRAMAANTRGCTSAGPGPIRVRRGGLKEENFMLGHFIVQCGEAQYKDGKP